MPIIPNWRTSSYTKSDNCVEVSDNDPAVVMVRDSKMPEEARLDLQPAAWANFVEFSKQQEV